MPCKWPRLYPQWAPSGHAHSRRWGQVHVLGENDGKDSPSFIKVVLLGDFHHSIKIQCSVSRVWVYTDYTNMNITSLISNTHACMYICHVCLYICLALFFLISLTILFHQCLLWSVHLQCILCLEKSSGKPRRIQKQIIIARCMQCNWWKHSMKWTAVGESLW